MKLSSKSDYALRAMLELALNYDRGTLRIEEIAKRAGVPVRYLEHLLLVLKLLHFRKLVLELLSS